MSTEIKEKEQEMDALLKERLNRETPILKGQGLGDEVETSAITTAAGREQISHGAGSSAEDKAVKAEQATTRATGDANTISTVAGAVAKGAEKELTSYERQFDENNDGKLDNTEERDKAEQEAKERAAVAKAVAGVAGLVIGGAAFASLSNAIGQEDAGHMVDDLSHVPGGAFACSDCPGANSLPTSAKAIASAIQKDVNLGVGD